MDSLYNLYNLFVSQCKEEGDLPAIIYHNQIVSYNQVYANSDRIYKKLLDAGVNQGDVVGLAVKRSPNIIAVMIAVLRAGATYMPFNPLQKESDWSRMIIESGCKVVLSDWTDVPRFHDRTWIEIEKFDFKIRHETEYINLEEKNLKNNAYIIYTSGTTGKSKGVGIRQESLLNLIMYGTKEIGLVRGQVIISLSNFAFDMSVPETIMPVLLGMTIAMLDDDEIINPRIVRNRIQEYKVSTMLITPTRMNILLTAKKGTDFLKTVHYILFGAEMISNNLIEKLKAISNARIFNLYGPTETTAYLTYSEITDKTVYDIGNTIENTRIYLIREDNSIVEGAGEGEIVIAGIGVADGYISDDINNSFRVCETLPEEKVYFTGDMARRLDNGEIIYLGRRDNQIKYRGYRLGLEEIEDKIRCNVKDIIDCAVCVYKDDENEYLTMLYVALTDLTMSFFKGKLSNCLANYAIPIKLIRVASLPLNKNSKIDRMAVAQLVKEYMLARIEVK